MVGDHGREAGQLVAAGVHALRVDGVVLGLDAALCAGAGARAQAGADAGASDGTDGRTAPAADDRAEPGAEGGAQDGAADGAIVGDLRLAGDGVARACAALIVFGDELAIGLTGCRDHLNQGTQGRRGTAGEQAGARCGAEKCEMG